MGGERLHLADSDLVEPCKALFCGELHVDELGIHCLDVGEHEKLFDGSVVADIAV